MKLKRTPIYDLSVAQLEQRIRSYEGQLAHCQALGDNEGCAHWRREMKPYRKELQRRTQ